MKRICENIIHNDHIFYNEDILLTIFLLLGKDIIQMSMISHSFLKVMTNYCHVAENVKNYVIELIKEERFNFVPRNIHSISIIHNHVQKINRLEYFFIKKELSRFGFSVEHVHYGNKRHRIDNEKETYVYTINIDMNINRNRKHKKVIFPHSRHICIDITKEKMTKNDHNNIIFIINTLSNTLLQCNQYHDNINYVTNYMSEYISSTGFGKDDHHNHFCYTNREIRLNFLFVEYIGYY